MVLRPSRHNRNSTRKAAAQIESRKTIAQLSSVVRKRAIVPPKLETIAEVITKAMPYGACHIQPIAGRADQWYRVGMTTISYAGYRFPAEIIQHAVWIYLRFTLSYRDVEELLAERGIDVSYETVRRWVTAFGPRCARRLRAARRMPSSTWHLDEMSVSIGGRRMYLWRAVDAEGEMLDILVQSKRDQWAAQRLMRNSCINSG